MQYLEHLQKYVVFVKNNCKMLLLQSMHLIHLEEIFKHARISKDPRV